MIRYLLDENLPGGVSKAITNFCTRSGIPPVDFLRVGGEDAPGYGAPDPELLVWAEQAGRILVSDDVNTMPGYLFDHLANGGYSPGLLLRRPGVSLILTAEWLVTIAQAGSPEEYANTVTWIPLQATARP